MPNSTELREIIERLEKLEDPDREMDWRVYCAVQGYEFESLDGDSCTYGVPLGSFVAPIEKKASHYTASLDAAVALVEKMLPEQVVEIFKQALDDWCSGLATAKAADFPRYVLIAIFRALEQKP